MKITLLLLLLLNLTAFHARATDSTRVNFRTGAWPSVLAEARRLNRPVFVDVYSTWCGPCKKMEKEAFTNPAVASRMNGAFVNYRVDAEKGDGIGFAKTYSVRSYPTVLIITADGAVQYRSTGYGTVKRFSEELEKGLAQPQTRARVKAMSQRFAAEKTDPVFLRQYLDALTDAELPLTDVLDAYVSQLPDSAQKLPAVYVYVAERVQSASTKAFDFLLAHRPPLSFSFGSDPVTTAYYSATGRALDADYEQAVQLKSDSLLNRLIDNADRDKRTKNPFAVRNDSLRQVAADEYRLKFYRETRQFDRYKPVAARVAEPVMNQIVANVQRQDSMAAVRMKMMMKILPDSMKRSMPASLITGRESKNIRSRIFSRALNDLAVNYLKQATSPADLQTALTWSDRAVLLNNAFIPLSTNALLLHKLGRKAEALKQREQALDAAKQEKYRDALAEKALDVILR
jgi:thiol-disulfide isomerase/thioredoxin